MVRTEISTTYGELIHEDTIFLNDEPHIVKDIYPIDGGYYRLSLANQSGTRRVLVEQGGNDAVNRAARA